VLAAARQATRLHFWDGDIREGPYWVPLPVPSDGRGGDPRCIVAWKQDYEDLTIIASPAPLPWLTKEDPNFGYIEQWLASDFRV